MSRGNHYYTQGFGFNVQGKRTINYGGIISEIAVTQSLQRSHFIFTIFRLLCTFQHRQFTPKLVERINTGLCDTSQKLLRDLLVLNIADISGVFSRINLSLLEQNSRIGTGREEREVGSQMSLPPQYFTLKGAIGVANQGSIFVSCVGDFGALMMGKSGDYYHQPNQYLLPITADLSSWINGTDESMNAVRTMSANFVYGDTGLISSHSLMPFTRQKAFQQSLTDQTDHRDFVDSIKRLERIGKEYQDPKIGVVVYRK